MSRVQLVEKVHLGTSSSIAYFWQRVVCVCVVLYENLMLQVVTCREVFYGRTTPCALAWAAGVG